MEMSNDLNGTKILHFLKPWMFYWKTKTFDKMFLKQLVSKGECEKYVIGSKYAFNCTKPDHSSALDL